MSLPTTPASPGIRRSQRYARDRGRLTISIQPRFRQEQLQLARRLMAVTKSARLWPNLRSLPCRLVRVGQFLPKLNSRHAVTSANLVRNVSQLSLLPGFQSRNLAKVSKLECRANGTRLAFAPSSIPQ